MSEDIFDAFSLGDILFPDDAPMTAQQQQDLTDVEVDDMGLCTDPTDLTDPTEDIRVPKITPVKKAPPRIQPPKITRTTGAEKSKRIAKKVCRILVPPSTPSTPRSMPSLEEGTPVQSPIMKAAAASILHPYVKTTLTPNTTIQPIMKPVAPVSGIPVPVFPKAPLKQTTLIKREFSLLPGDIKAVSKASVKRTRSAIIAICKVSF